MKCPYCSSTEVVAIQNQNYCLNCGQQVAEIPKVDVTTLATSKAPSTENNLPKPSDQPLHPATAVQSRPAQAKPTPKPLVVAAADTSRPKTDSISSDQSKDKVASNRSRLKPTVPDSPHPARSALNVITHHLWISAFLTSTAASAITLYFSTSFWNELKFVDLSTSSRTLGLRYLIISIIILLAGSAVLYLYHNSTRAKVIYFSVRQLDGRRAEGQQMGMAAMSAYWHLISLDTLVLLMLIPLTTVQYFIFFHNSAVPNTAGLLRPVIITLAQLTLIYSYVGLLFSRLFGSRAIVLAAQKPLVALRWGWQVFWHNSSDIAIWGTEAIAFSSIFILPIIVFLKTGTLLSGFNTIWLAQLILLCTVCGYFLMVFNLSYWSSIYFSLCSQAQPSQRQIFLGSTLKLRPSSVPLTWALFTVMLIEAGVYAGWTYQTQLASWLTPLLKAVI